MTVLKCVVLPHWNKY